MSQSLLAFLGITLLAASPGVSETGSRAASSRAWSQYGLPPTDNPCAIPAAYPNDSWKWELYHQWMKGAASVQDKNVVLLGDSLTAGWNNTPGYPNGAEVLKDYAAKYPQIRPISFGMSGDGPENTLWLVTAGKLPALFPSPKVIVLMIGINSLNKFSSKNQTEFDPENVAEGIATIVDCLQRERPGAKLLLLGILPCWGPTAPVRQAISQTNKRIRSLADDKDIFFLDFGRQMLLPDGKIKPELTYDDLHLTSQGYALWASMMFPCLEELLAQGKMTPPTGETDVEIRQY